MTRRRCVFWVPCKRCGEMKREDSFCECATREEIEVVHAFLTHPEKRTERQQETERS